MSIGKVNPSKLIISTRPNGKSDVLGFRLNRLGFEFAECPLIAVEQGELDDASIQNLKELDRFKWLIFTSANGVRYLFKHLKSLGINQIPEHFKCAVIGKATGSVLAQHGITADFISNTGTGRGFIEEFSKEFGKDKTMLWPTGNLAPTDFEEYFPFCKRMDVYATRSQDGFTEEIKARINADNYHLILLFSPSAVESLVKYLPMATDFTKIKVACIGSVTQNRCIELGINPILTAKKPSVDGILETIETYKQR